MSGFALPSLIHNNQPLLFRFLIFETSATADRAVLLVNPVIFQRFTIDFHRFQAAQPPKNAARETPRRGIGTWYEVTEQQEITCRDEVMTSAPRTDLFLGKGEMSFFQG